MIKHDMYKPCTTMCNGLNLLSHISSYAAPLPQLQGCKETGQKLHRHDQATSTNGSRIHRMKALPCQRNLEEFIEVSQLNWHNPIHTASLLGSEASHWIKYQMLNISTHWLITWNDMKWPSKCCKKTQFTTWTQEPKKLLRCAGSGLQPGRQPEGQG